MIKKRTMIFGLLATLALAACEGLPTEVSAMVNTAEEAVSQTVTGLQEGEIQNANRPRPNGPNNPGGQENGSRPERSNPIADALGLTQEEFRAALEAGQTVEELAEEAGVDLAQVILEDAAGQLAQAVENGRLTQEEADQRLAEMQERIENGELPIGPSGPGGPGGQENGSRPERSNPIADALGLTQEEFRAALEAGQTVEELAEEAGVDLAQVILEDAAGQLEQAVENGRLTQEEADQRLAEMQERIENGELPLGPGGPGGQGKPGGPGRPGNQGRPEGSQGAPGATGGDDPVVL